MNYLRNVVSDVKLKYRAGRVVYDCIAKREQPEFTQYLTESVSLADGHPVLVLTTLHEYLTFRHPENAYGGLLLLEQLVSLCNYGFHLALAKDYEIQDRIIQLAVKRGEGEAHRKAQRLARLTLLEYSRVFVDDRELLRLSSLASSFEYRTRKSLMRCLNVQNRRVRFRDVDKSDIIPISPKESRGSTSASNARALAPLQLSSAPEVWPCHVCTYLNAPLATRCAACETLRSVDSHTHRITPAGTPKTTPKIAPQPSPPTPPATPPPTPPAAAPSLPLGEDLSDRDGDAPGLRNEAVEGANDSSSISNHVSSSRSGPSVDSHRHTDGGLSLPPAAVSAEVGPTTTATFCDPEHLDEEATPADSSFTGKGTSPLPRGLEQSKDTAKEGEANGEVKGLKYSGYEAFAAHDVDTMTPPVIADAAVEMAEATQPIDAPLSFFLDDTSSRSL